MPIAQAGDTWMLWAQQNGSIWPLVGVVAAMLLLLLTFWRIGRRAGSRSEAPWAGPGNAPPGADQRGSRSDFHRGSPADAPASLTAWEVHLHETAREASAVVDTKVRLLRQLVAEADRAATRLERALSAARQALPAQADSSEPISSSPGGLSNRRGAEEAPLEVELLADYGFPVEDIANRCGLTVSEVESILRRRSEKNQPPKDSKG